MSSHALAPNFHARAEREALCDLFLKVGPDAPTLCEGWDTRDLAAHLKVREGRNILVAMGIMMPALAGVTAKAQAKAAALDYRELVEAVRSGPPRGTMVRSPKVDGAMNTIEFFVHHEDVRRAQDGWAPRALSQDFSELLWERTAQFGKRLVGKSPVGVIARHTDGRTAVLHEGPTPVTVVGDPGEIIMQLYRREGSARATVEGDPAAVAALRTTLDSH